MSQTSGPAAAKKKQSAVKRLLNWPMVRKLESLVFLAMFLAMPLFAFRVIDYTQRQVALQNAAHDLVKDIRRAKEMGLSEGYEVTVEAVKGLNGKSASYVIRHESQLKEEVILPRAVSLLGQVTFHPDGKPISPATFELHTDNHSLSVDVDAQGAVSMP